MQELIVLATAFLIAIPMYLVIYINEKKSTMSLRKYKARKHFLAFTFVAIAVVLAFRRIDGVLYGGIDAKYYIDRFLNADGNIIQSLQSQNNEYGYGLFVYIIRRFTDNYRIYLIVYNLLLFYLVWRALRCVKITNNSKMIVYLAVVCFFSISVITSMCLMRNYLALFIIFESYMKLKDKKYFSSLILSLIATSIHVSAIMFVVIVLLSCILRKYQFSMSVYLFLGILAFLFGFVFGPIVQDLLINSKYSVYAAGNSFAYFLFYYRISLIAMCLINYRINTKENRVLLLSLFIGLFAFSLQLFLSIIYRVHIYFDVLLCMLLLEISKKPKQLKTLTSINESSYKLIINRFYVLSVLVYYIFISFAKGIISYGLFIAF